MIDDGLLHAIDEDGSPHGNAVWRMLCGWQFVAFLDGQTVPPDVNFADTYEDITCEACRARLVEGTMWLVGEKRPSSNEDEDSP
jgi:hypothetical protein